MSETLSSPFQPRSGQLYVTEHQRIVRVRDIVLMPDEATPAVAFTVLSPEPGLQVRVKPMTEFGKQAAPFELLMESESGRAAEVLSQWVAPAQLLALLAGISSANRPYRTLAWLDAFFDEAQRQGRMVTPSQALAALAHCLTAGLPESAGRAILFSLDTEWARAAGVTSADFEAAQACLTALTEPELASDENTFAVRDLAWAWLAAPFSVVQAVQQLRTKEEVPYLSPEQRATYEKSRLAQLLKWAKSAQMFPSMSWLEPAARSNIEQIRLAWLARHAG